MNEIFKSLSFELTKDFYISYLKYINREDIIPIFEERWKKT